MAGIMSPGTDNGRGDGQGAGRAPAGRGVERWTTTRCARGSTTGAASNCGCLTLKTRLLDAGGSQPSPTRSDTA
ncbi:hypothetical protein [Streptomyces sp. NPDC057854]|uniref:hypothetical protein n=1 Tax=unclassified Streptomyces TaxID=2593676 RepID=UPI0036C44BB4